MPSGLAWFFKEGLASLVALATGVVALLFTLFPGLKPFTATTLSAKVKVVSIERAITRDEWRWRVAVGDPERYGQLVKEDNKAAHVPARQPCNVLGAAPGHLIYVATEAHGFKRHQLTVRAALYTYPSRRRVPDPEGYRDLAKIPVDAPTSFSVEEIWLYDPGPSTRRYFARVELYDPSQHLLDIADSKVFPAITDAELAALPSDCLRRPG